MKKSSNFSKDLIAQGTIEYLVIIAVVVVIALIVVALVLNQTSSVSATDQKTTNLAWQSKEIQVKDFVVDAEGRGTIVLASNLPQGVTMDSIVIQSVSNSASSKKLFLGAINDFSLTNLPACTGQNQKYSITLNYTTLEGLVKSVTGEFYANCVTNALTLDSLSLSTSDASVVTNTSVATGYLVLVNSSAVNTDSIDDFTEGTNSDSQLTITTTEVKLRTN